MKCSLMGRCASFNFLPVIWEWSKDQKLPRQEGNKCRGIWNSQNLGGIPVFFFFSVSQKNCTFFPELKKKIWNVTLRCQKKSEVWLWDTKKLWNMTLRYQKNLKCDFEMPQQNLSNTLCPVSVESHFLNPNFVACCGRGWSEPGQQGMILCILTTLLDVILQVLL